jgi:hypothetical protein
MAPWTGQTIPDLLAGTPQGVKGWRPVFLSQLNTIVYVPAK